VVIQTANWACGEVSFDRKQRLMSQPSDDRKRPCNGCLILLCMSCPQFCQFVSLQQMTKGGSTAQDRDELFHF
jgi:hypothetical protein